MKSESETSISATTDLLPSCVASTTLPAPTPSSTSASVANSTTPVAEVVAACFKASNAAEAVEAPVPPLAIDKSVPDQLPLLIVLAVDKEPKPNVVLCAAASASSSNALPAAVRS